MTFLDELLTELLARLLEGILGSLEFLLILDENAQVMLLVSLWIAETHFFPVLSAHS